MVILQELQVLHKVVMMVVLILQLHNKENQELKVEMVEIGTKKEETQIIQVLVGQQVLQYLDQIIQ